MTNDRYQPELFGSRPDPVQNLLPYDGTVNDYGSMRGAAGGTTAFSQLITSDFLAERCGLDVRETDYDQTEVCLVCRRRTGSQLFGCSQGSHYMDAGTIGCSQSDMR